MVFSALQVSQKFIFVVSIMLVAFISECRVFSGILSKAMETKFEVIRFEHFTSPDDFLSNPMVEFPVIIFKLTDQEKFDSRVTHIKQRFPAADVIGLMLGKNYKTLKGREKSFDYLFTDSEIEEKLNVYISQRFSKQVSFSDNFKIEHLKRKYIHLHPLKSRCFSLILQGKTAAEIALEMNKSTRTIEKYIIYLRQYFSVDKKKDLIEIGRQIQT